MWRGEEKRDVFIKMVKYTENFSTKQVQREQEDEEEESDGKGEEKEVYLVK